ncbi:MAG TPA: hypothetical protein VFQ38_14465 [Longimicrobiales bacterium]|nr:hypothetical protein [Longimicrobiales bacterium]
MRSIRFFFLAAVVALAAGCGDALGPQTWSAVPDTVTLYSASRTELTGLPSGYDFTTGLSITVESPGQSGSWDLVVADRTGGGFSFLPSGAVLGGSGGAGIAAVSGQTLDAVKEAPSDTTAYARSTDVPVTVDGVYAIRTRRVNCSLGSGVHYAKLHVISTDPVRGSVQFEVVRNPFCDDRKLIPPQN